MKHPVFVYYFPRNVYIVQKKALNVQHLGSSGLSFFGPYLQTGV